MKIEVHLSIGLVGCRRKITFEVEDDCTDEQIDEIAREAIFELVEWQWERTPGGES